MQVIIKFCKLFQISEEKQPHVFPRQGTSQDCRQTARTEWEMQAEARGSLVLVTAATPAKYRQQSDLVWCGKKPAWRKNKTIERIERQAGAEMC